jgi:SAM-dependent methyltransferase
MLPAETWTWLNRKGIFDDPELRRYVSPFPPVDIMESVSGLTREQDFASHGADFFLSLSAASPKPLTEYHHLLDFGCGCGRLARLFKGHPHKVSGCDIDRRQVKWVQENLSHVEARLSSVQPPLPYDDDTFDGVISISIFSHLNEASQDQFLSELHRVTQAGGYLFLTVHGKIALERSVLEREVKEMISVDETLLKKAYDSFFRGEYAFILQHGHLTNLKRVNRPTMVEKIQRWMRKGVAAPQAPSELISEYYEYGITYIPEEYLRRHWSRWFSIVDYIPGGIYGWQDIAVLTPSK